MSYHNSTPMQAGQAVGTNLSASWLDEPPDNIEGPFEFTVEITNNGSGRNWDIDAVLSNQDTGNNYLITPLTAQFIGEGGTIEADYIISETELADAPAGSYRLRILMEPALEEGPRSEVIGKNLTVSGTTGQLPGDGGGGIGAGSPSLKTAAIIGGSVIGGVFVTSQLFGDDNR